MGFDFAGRIPDPEDENEYYIYMMDVDGNNQSSLYASNIADSDPILSY